MDGLVWSVGFDLQCFIYLTDIGMVHRCLMYLLPGAQNFSYLCFETTFIGIWKRMKSKKQNCSDPLWVDAGVDVCLDNVPLASACRICMDIVLA